LSCLVLSCLVLSCLVLSCLVLCLVCCVSCVVSRVLCFVCCVSCVVSRVLCLVCCVSWCLRRTKGILLPRLDGKVPVNEIDCLLSQIFDSVLLQDECETKQTLFILDSSINSKLFSLEGSVRTISYSSGETMGENWGNQGNQTYNFFIYRKGRR
jgi:hypothetical protein